MSTDWAGVRVEVKTADSPGAHGTARHIAQGFYFLVGPEHTYIAGYTLNVSGGLLMK